MSAALQRLDEEQLPGGCKGVAREMFETLAPEMSGLKRVALSNLWLFGRWCESQLAKGASTNAMLRTTTALTIVNAGNKSNVIPGQAEATLDFRILPGDTTDKVLQHVRAKALARHRDQALGGSTEPTPVSSTDGAVLPAMQRTCARCSPARWWRPA
jgi:carboxypeptidase PM20D1